jgi:MFS transporter, DHA1 family, multidrug resistance protein
MEPPNDRTVTDETRDLEDNPLNTTTTKHEPDTDSESCPHDDKSSSLVTGEGPNDKTNPRNWSVARRLAITTAVALCTFTTTFGSSAMAPATYVLAQKFGVSPTVILLSVALYVFGFATGMDNHPQCIRLIFADTATRSSSLGSVI